MELRLRLLQRARPEAADAIENGSEVEVDFDTGEIRDITSKKTYKAQPFPPFIQNIIKAGGLLASLKENQTEKSEENM